MSISILLANVLVLFAFFLHAFQGDKEIRSIEPAYDTEEKYIKQEKWTMARCGWHWVSFDLLFIGIGLALINFTDYFKEEKIVLQICALYFLGYAAAWLLAIVISKQFPKNYLRLGQWMLLLLISGLLFFGNDQGL